jgi:hypothetical protein
VEGTAYSQTIQATGFGTLSYSISAGALPAGLTLNTSSGAITGTPLGPNTTSNFTVTVTDSSNPKQTGSKALSITINLPPPPVISPTTLPNGNVGSPYSQTLSVSGGLGPTFTWIVSSGTLPAGLTLTSNNTTAKINGTPATAQTNVAFTIQVTDSSVPPQSGSQNYTVTINPPAPLSITTTSLANGAFNTAYNATISATGGIAPYAFSLDAASSPLPAGLAFTNSNNQGVISGTPTTAGMFTNIIVDVHDSQVPTAATASKTYTLTITASAIVISPASGALPTGTVSTAYTTNITASGGVAPYTFSLDATSATLPPNLSFSSNASSATISGTPTTAGTTSNIIVDVSDSESPAVTVKATYSITINPSASACGSGNESVFKGQYAFLMQGFDASGPVAIGGAFSADGTGKIALLVGVEDINSAAGVQTNVAIASAGSSYSVGSDNRGCLTLATGSGTSTYRFSLGSVSSGVATKGRIIRFDNTGTLGSGLLRLQDPAAFSTAAISGNFAFGASSSLDLSLTTRNRFGFIGSLVAAGGVITTGEEDFNFDGSVDNGTAGPVAITSGSYSVSANGRGTLSLTVSGTGTFNDTIYVVSATEFLFMNIGARSATNPLFAGSALKQSGGPFTTSSLSGNAVFYTAGICGGCGPASAPAAPNVGVGVVSVTTPGSFSFTNDNNKGGTVSSQTVPGTYTVDASGRALLTPTATPGVPLVAVYLVSPNQGFVLTTTKSVETGFSEQQAAGPFTNASLNGTFFGGTTNQVDQNVTDNSGSTNYDGAGSATGMGDNATIGPTPTAPNLDPGHSFSLTYSVTNGMNTPGRGTIPIGGALNLIFYIVSPSKVIIMGAPMGNAYPSITIAEK